MTVRRALLMVPAVTLVAVVLAHADQTRALLLGIGTGALVAAIASAVVLTYRGAGVGYCDRSGITKRKPDRWPTQLSHLPAR